MGQQIKGRYASPDASDQRFSHRLDPLVPAFEDNQPIAFMDGDCVLCTFGARMIARFDKQGEIKICPVQSDLGQAVLTHYGLDVSDPDSWLFLEDGKVWTSMEAIIRVGERIGGIGRLLSVLRILPRPVREWLYRRIARNRYALLGRREMCMMPEPSLSDRLIG